MAAPDPSTESIESSATQSPAAAPEQAPEGVVGEAIPLDAIFTQLEDIVTQLEAGERPLEEALQLFAQGMSLCQQGTQRLDATEAAIEQLLRDAHGRDDVVAPLKKQ